LTLERDNSIPLWWSLYHVVAQQEQEQQEQQQLQFSLRLQPPTVNFTALLPILYVW
jgi:hypothetical protein